MTDGEVADVGLELLGEAGRLAKAAASTVTALVPGDGSVKPYEKLAAYGADRVVYLQNPALGAYATLPYTRALQKAVEELKPEILLFGASPIGRDLAPRLSARLRTGLTADCTGLEIEAASGNLLMTRPAFGGNLMATIVCGEHRPQMATVRPGVMQRAAKKDAQAEILEIPVEIPEEDFAVEILETVMNPPSKLNIREAKVLVSGGRGMASPEGFGILEEIAALLGGTIASSRAAVDAGWQPKDRQVGQTGQTVRPDLYIACGISGAIQHVAGMEESGIIIAINKDENAPIFGIADLGIVGNVNSVLPELKRQLESATA
ncbi:MAG: electron transfer flavoprotein subunit alpha/FixB family protein [Oscillospiraceae bacterium]|nr:electron transfer flavoprotein subunit alpha/FixB family protein [Oscillospiraceae bacterium]